MTIKEYKEKIKNQFDEEFKRNGHLKMVLEMLMFEIKELYKSMDIDYSVKYQYINAWKERFKDALRAGFEVGSDKSCNTIFSDMNVSKNKRIS